MRPVVCMLAVLLICGEAHGFSRSRDPDNDVCLRWKSRMVTYFINETCSVDVQLNSCLEAVQAAFNAWNGHACSDMQIFYGGTTPRRDVGYDQSKTNNINLVVWLESQWQTHDCPPEKPVCREARAGAEDPCRAEGGPGAPGGTRGMTACNSAHPPRKGARVCGVRRRGSCTGCQGEVHNRRAGAVPACPLAGPSWAVGHRGPEGACPSREGVTEGGREAHPTWVQAP